MAVSLPLGVSPIPVVFQLTQRSIFDPYLDVQKIYDCSIRYFRPFRCFWTLSWGVKKVITANQIQTTPLPSIHKVMELAEGCLYLGSVPFEAALSLHEFGLSNLGVFVPLVRGAGSGLFLFSLLVSLSRHISAYRCLSKLLLHATEAQKFDLKKQQTLAVMGMLSSIGYIFMAACMLLGFHIAIALIFGCIGGITNAFEFLYNYFKSR